MKETGVQAPGTLQASGDGAGCGPYGTYFNDTLRQRGGLGADGFADGPVGSGTGDSFVYDWMRTDYQAAP